MRLISGIFRSLWYMLVVQVIFVAGLVGAWFLDPARTMQMGLTDLPFWFGFIFKAFYSHKWWMSACIFLFFFAIHLFKMKLLFKTVRFILLAVLIGGAIFFIFYSIVMVIFLLIISVCVWLASDDVTYIGTDWTGRTYIRRGRKF